jgi:SEC-C motif-containing protein
VDFVRLDVHGAEAEGDRGRVQFTAHFVHAGEGGALEEHSRFRRLDGRWLYLDGEPDAPDV